MRAFTREVTVTRSYVELDGQEFDRGGMLDLMDALEDSCMVGRVMIDDPCLRAALEVRDVIRTSIRGSSYRADGFEAFYKQLRELKVEAE